MGKLGLRPAYRRVAIGFGAVAAMSAGFLLIAGPASAHSAPITGSAVCSSNGTYTVTYEVHVSTVDHKAIPWSFELYSAAPAGSTVSPTTATGVGDSSLTLVQTDVPEVASTARVIGEVSWQDGYTSGSQTGTVPLTGSCPSGTVAPPPVTSTSATAPSSVGTTSTAPTSVSNTSTAPTSVASTTTAPTTVAGTTTAATTAPAGSSSSVIAPPAPTSSAATTAPVSSFNNAPPPPTSHAIEATTAANTTTSAVAIDAPSPSPSTSAVSSPALASTGPELPVDRTIGLAGFFLAVGGLMLVLSRRRQNS